LVHNVLDHMVPIVVGDTPMLSNCSDTHLVRTIFDHMAPIVGNIPLVSNCSDTQMIDTVVGHMVPIAIDGQIYFSPFSPFENG
jgi:hypothetical protein